MRAAIQGDGPGIRLSLSGEEPEAYTMLTQLVALGRGGAYRLEFRYRTIGIDFPSGITWQVSDRDTGHVVAQSEDLSASSETQEGLSFNAPFECRWIEVSLMYERAPGTTRPKGAIAVKQLRISPIAERQ